MYRAAQDSDPQIAAKVKEIGEKVMRSSAVDIDVGGGKKDIVFFRQSLTKLDPAARFKAKSAMKALQKIRTELAKPNLPEAEVARLTAKYKDVLDGIHEFERTGSTLDLFMPHKNLRALASVGSFLGKRLVSEDSKAASSTVTKSAGCLKSLQDVMRHAGIGFKK
jgi:hypothetical protein